MSVIPQLYDEPGAIAGLWTRVRNRTAMPMRTRSFRLTDDEWVLVCEAADARHASFSRFVREAAIARAIYEQGMRSADPGKTMLEIIKRLRA